MNATNGDTSKGPLADISVGSRFWAFDLARELSRAGMLRHLHTGYPAFVAPRFGVPRRCVRSVWTGEPLNRLIALLHQHEWIREKKDSYLGERHDRIVAARLQRGAEIFIGWSSQCRESITAAQRLGMITIVERGAAHIRWQTRLLMEEAERTGLPVEIPHPRSVEQELAEYEAADYIAVPGEFVAGTFVEEGTHRDKLLINPYGVDVRLFSPLAKRPEQVGTHGLRVLHVGRISVQKGIHYLIDAVRHVPGARLTLVGALDVGMSTVVCDKPGVTVVGPVGRDQLPKWYANADVFCLLSVQDGFGMVIAQAMAMGLPVVASANTGAAELIRNGIEGFIVPARDASAAGARLQQLADDADVRFEMGQRARARISEGFDWSHYGTRAREHYCTVLSRRGYPKA